MLAADLCYSNSCKGIFGKKVRCIVRVVYFSIN